MVCTLELAAPPVAAGVAEEELERLGERIAELSGHLAAATGVWLGLVAQFDRRLGWAVCGVRSCAHWLSWRCGITLGAAREHVRVARALDELPLLAAELSAGRLSYSKLRALTRVATPATEADLVALANCSTGAQLERLVSGMRAAQSPEQAEARHSARSLSWTWAEDGSLVLRGRFDAADGALIVAAVEAVRDAFGPAESGSGASNADALVAIVENSLTASGTGSTGGERHLVHIHTDLETLLSGAEAGRVEDGPGLPQQTLRRILCDSVAVVVAHHERGNPGTSMDVGRRTRVIPSVLRRALSLRDRGCRFPGCTNRRFVDAHHVVHWIAGGRTDLANLISLCRAHHRLHHEGGYAIKVDGHGGFDFVGRGGIPIPAVPQPLSGAAEELSSHHCARITADTAWPDWRGERLDLPLTVELLLRAEQQAADQLRNLLT